ncbi:unnamed protein product [Chrysodeixis includens]|uniref:Uncharacterized protein n=1 Tax=Chrysodeixis includens TaxID=689277 RepID=A0A9P0BUB6_CHRIL|nr:unnamed protein product [Chrysodeixis includens]
MWTYAQQAGEGEGEQQRRAALGARAAHRVSAAPGAAGARASPACRHGRRRTARPAPAHSLTHCTGGHCGHSARTSHTRALAAGLGLGLPPASAARAPRPRPRAPVSAPAPRAPPSSDELLIRCSTDLLLLQLARSPPSPSSALCACDYKNLNLV